MLSGCAFVVLAWALLCPLLKWEDGEDAGGHIPEKEAGEIWERTFACVATVGGSRVRGRSRVWPPRVGAELVSRAPGKEFSELSPQQLQLLEQSSAHLFHGDG